MVLAAVLGQTYPCSPVDIWLKTWDADTATAIMRATDGACPTEYWDLTTITLDFDGTLQLVDVTLHPYVTTAEIESVDLHGPGNLMTVRIVEAPEYAGCDNAPSTSYSGNFPFVNFNFTGGGDVWIVESQTYMCGGEEGEAYEMLSHRPLVDVPYSARLWQVPSSDYMTWYNMAEWKQTCLSGDMWIDNAWGVEDVHYYGVGKLIYWGLPWMWFEYPPGTWWGHGSWLYVTIHMMPDSYNGPIGVFAAEEMWAPNFEGLPEPYGYNPTTMWDGEFPYTQIPHDRYLTCVGDLTGDFTVNIEDIMMCLAYWNDPEDQMSGPFNIQTYMQDILGHWGDCP
jgi:hypothetical protein